MPSNSWFQKSSTPCMASPVPIRGTKLESQGLGSRGKGQLRMETLGGQDSEHQVMKQEMHAHELKWQEEDTHGGRGSGADYLGGRSDLEG